MLSHTVYKDKERHPPTLTLDRDTRIFFVGAPSNVNLVTSVRECIHPKPERKRLLADRALRGPPFFRSRYSKE